MLLGYIKCSSQQPKYSMTCLKSEQLQKNRKGRGRTNLVHRSDVFLPFPDLGLRHHGVLSPSCHRTTIEISVIANCIRTDNQTCSALQNNRVITPFNKSFNMFRKHGVKVFMSQYLTMSVQRKANMPPSNIFKWCIKLVISHKWSNNSKLEKSFECIQLEPEVPPIQTCAQCLNSTHPIVYEIEDLS